MTSRLVSSLDKHIAHPIKPSEKPQVIDGKKGKWPGEGSVDGQSSVSRQVNRVR
jgi:hypothetical protein